MEKYKILLADDDPFVHKGTGEFLKKKGFLVTTADSGEEAVRMLEKFSFDLVITDLVMRETDGIGVLKKSKEVSPETVNIILTGHGNMDSAIDAVRFGADDYLLKPCENKEMFFRISSCLEKLELKRKIRRSEQALHDSEEKLKAIMNAAADAIILLDDHGKIIYSNPATEKIFGYTVQELTSKEMHLLLIPAEFHETYRKGFEEFQKTGQIPAVGKIPEITAVRKDRTVFPVELSVSALKINNRWHAAGIVRDITGRKEKQEEVARARKLESLGILAGGIAHDFNNLLYVILGNISMVREDLKSGAEISEFLKLAETASLKAKDLTNRLITFSKGGAPFKKAGSVGDTVRETANLALSESDVKCEFFIPPDLQYVEFDERQMKQAFRNLIINAAESMESGRSVVVSAENTRIDSETSEKKLPGNYVKIIIRDQGVGIPEENLARIFDPYFSTRDRGTQKGMGLGLAITWSVITRHGGHITVESEVGTGTAFTIYLPVHEKEITKQKPGKKCADEKPAVRGGKILVMDDEEGVRDIAGHMLNRIGYDVEFASDGAEAIELYKTAMNSGKPFDAVILDLTVKGGIGGVVTVKWLLKTYPHVKAIVSSGYSNDPVMTDFRKYGFTGALAKPYTKKELADTLSAVQNSLTF